MTREDVGKYRLKHPASTAPDPAIAAALAELGEDGRITCPAAFAVAATQGVTPAAVGKTADLLEYRIVACDLGLFGYWPEKRIVKPVETIAADLACGVAENTVEGCITCAACWELAQTLGLEKMAVSGACEALGLKVVDCQLGAF
jgi:hypothetical protein